MQSVNGQLSPEITSADALASNYCVAPDTYFETAIFVQNLTKKFGKYFAVDDVCFIVPKGTTMGLVGGNGAGKTTTLSMIMGLTIPSYGVAKVLGCDMEKSRYQVLKKMNFQSPYVALPGRLTVRENLNVFGRLYNVKDLKNRIAEVVYDFGLGELINSEVGALSAGQKTRVSLAKALLNSPEVLLLDEPTASLDPGRAEWVRDLLQKYQRKHQATILMSSHNMNEVERMCDHVTVMDFGRVLAIETPADLMNKFNCRDLEKIIQHLARGQKEVALA